MYKEITSYQYQDAQSTLYLDGITTVSLPYYRLYLRQGQEKVTNKWTQKYLSDFLSTIGGLFTALIAVARFFISGYQSFISQKSMLKRLYGEEDLDARSGRSRVSREVDPKDELSEKLEKRRDFNTSFFKHIMIACFKSCCCCITFTRCC